MSDTPLLQGQELFKLIPQRAPIVMVDAFYEAADGKAHTGLTIAADNMFCRNGLFTEPGLIEHIAQSAAAFAGYGNYCQGKQPQLGFIGEVKKLRIQRLPEVGSQLHTFLEVKGEAAGVTLVAAETKEGEEVVATCQMKIFIKE